MAFKVTRQSMNIGDPNKSYYGYGILGIGSGTERTSGFEFLQSSGHRVCLVCMIQVQNMVAVDK